MKNVIKSMVAVIVIATTMPSCMTSSGTCHAGYKAPRKYQKTTWSNPVTPKFIVKKQKKGPSYSSLFCK
jgi:hypothetical protein